MLEEGWAAFASDLERQANYTEDRQEDYRRAYAEGAWYVYDVALSEGLAAFAGLVDGVVVADEVRAVQRMSRVFEPLMKIVPGWGELQRDSFIAGGLAMLTMTNFMAPERAAEQLAAFSPEGSRLVSMVRH